MTTATAAVATTISTNITSYAIITDLCSLLLLLLLLLLSLQFASDDPGEEGSYDYGSIAAKQLTPLPMLLQNDRPLTGVKAIGCGGYHSFAITQVGSRVYGSGVNQYGQLGLSDRELKNRLVPVHWLDGWDIVEVTGGTHHSLALGADGHLFSFGRSDYGQLGCTDAVPGPGASEIVPRVVPLQGARGKAVRIACGGNHGLVITDAEELYSWGPGDNCVLGLKGEADHPRPARVHFEKQQQCSGLRAYDVAAGATHTLVLAINT
jgi:alpha-tubulin suppressor-like RCC1 family protein